MIERRLYFRLPLSIAGLDEASSPKPRKRFLQIVYHVGGRCSRALRGALRPGSTCRVLRHEFPGSCGAAVRDCRRRARRQMRWPTASCMSSLFITIVSSFFVVVRTGAVRISGIRAGFCLRLGARQRSAASSCRCLCCFSFAMEAAQSGFSRSSSTAGCDSRASPTRCMAMSIIRTRSASLASRFISASPV